MTTPTARSPASTALLLLDLTSYVVEHYSSDPDVAERAAGALTSARDAGLPVFHVVPESLRADVHPRLTPLDGEPVLEKSTMGAFATTTLHQRLQDQHIGRVVVAGVATSGTVLSTTRWACDVGYRVTVCRDACADPDPDVHDALVNEDRFQQSWLGLWRIAEVVPTSAVRWSEGAPGE